MSVARGHCVAATTAAKPDACRSQEADVRRLPNQLRAEERGADDQRE